MALKQFEEANFVSSNLIKRLMEIVSKPCQDRILHPILVHSIIENDSKPNGADQKIIKPHTLLYFSGHG
jgi:hypothetical protein